MYAFCKAHQSSIVGTLETLRGRAEINLESFNADGTFEHAGYTEVFWDEQRTVQRDGKDVFLCEDGEEHTIDECVLHTEPDYPDEAQD